MKLGKNSYGEDWKGTDGGGGDGFDNLHQEKKH